MRNYRYTFGFRCELCRLCVEYKKWENILIKLNLFIFLLEVNLTFIERNTKYKNLRIEFNKTHKCVLTFLCISTKYGNYKKSFVPLCAFATLLYVKKNTKK